MQVRRLALAALVLSAALPAIPATAKPLPCKQISDPDGDGVAPPTGMKDATLDILSADISSGRSQVTAILRLKSGAIESDSLLPGGALWNFNVTVGGINYSYWARWPSLATSDRKLTGGLVVGNDPANPPATFRRDGNNFIWTVGRAAVAGLKKPKQYITVTSATSGANSFGGGDSAYAKTNTKYLDKSVTCLPSK